MFASLAMFITCLIVNFSPVLLDKLCPDCHGEAWNVPLAAAVALVYWIVFNSIVCYLITTWANQYADPSIVLGYTSFQPLTAAILSAIVVWSGYTKTHPKVNLQEPGWNALGGIAIIGALGLLTYDAWTQKKKERASQYQALDRALGTEA
mmetsp:Transcript_11187/g.13228  ORF Transcript_11187/g.13228 Transcript_11187/m.13228 type:complete len:150 (+) Transcript_11187:2-451(+)